MAKVFILIKPDGVKRGLVGECVNRFENAGLKVVAMRMLKLSEAMADKLYPSDKQWLENLGMKAKESMNKIGKDIKDDNVSHGKKVRQWLMDYVLSGPVVAMVLDGNDAMTVARKLVGPTDGAAASAGTIRGDFSSDSIVTATSEGRANMNVLHVSSDEKETENQTKIFFD